MEFIIKLLRKGGKETLLEIFLFVVGIFKSYDEAPPEHKPYRKKDGAMFVFGSLSDKLKKVDPYKSELERMLVDYIFPEFNSSAGHLRAKAAWVAGQYANINFSDQNNFNTALHSVVGGLHDHDLPVRVDSHFALRSFASVCENFDEISASVPQLSNDFLNLMNAVENDEPVYTLETILVHSGEVMAPHAVRLCEHLVAAYNQGALAASRFFRAISLILKSARSLPQGFVEIETKIFPIMQTILATRDEDSFDAVLEIASFMASYSPNISSNMWSLWPLMVDALVNRAVDFFPNILVAMNTFISKGTTHFLTNYHNSLYEVLSTLMTDENLDDFYIESAPKLVEVVFQNCKGQVDQWVEPYLQLIMKGFQRAVSSYLRSLLINVVANMLYYDPVLTLRVLRERKLDSKVFDIWFHMLQQKRQCGLPKYFKREHDKYICCLGFTSLLALPDGQLSDEELHRVFKATLDLLVAYKDQLAEREAKLSDEGSDESDWSDKSDWSDGSDVEMDDTEDRDEAENMNDRKLVAQEYDDDGSDVVMGMDDTEYIDEAENMNHLKLSAQAKFSCSDSDSSDDEDSDCNSMNDDYEEDYQYELPTDEVDAFALFDDVIKDMRASNPQRFESLWQSLDVNYQALAKRILKRAELRRVEMEMEKEKEAGEAASTP